MFSDFYCFISLSFSSVSPLEPSMVSILGSGDFDITIGYVVSGLVIDFICSVGWEMQPTYKFANVDSLLCA